MAKPHCDTHMRFSAQCADCAAAFEAEQKKKLTAKPPNKDEKGEKAPQPDKATKDESKKPNAEKKILPPTPPVKIKMGKIMQQLSQTGSVAKSIEQAEALGYTFMTMAPTLVGSMLLIFRYTGK